MMELIEIQPSLMNWRLDFSPLQTPSAFLPAVAMEEDGKLLALTGFDRKDQPKLEVLVIKQSGGGPSLSELMESLWRSEQLMPLEQLRLSHILGRHVPFAFLLEWPLPFQNFLDSKQMPLKNLRPLESLAEWKNEVVETLMRAQATSSQIRELLDLICDLKYLGLSWNELSGFSPNAPDWINSLRRLRTPQASDRDDKAAQAVRSLPWPRGTIAKWERQGDQSALLLQARITNSHEWQKLQENLKTMSIGESLWN